MTVTLSPDTEQRIAERIRGGGYASAEELVEEAVERFLAEETEDRREVVAAIRTGLQDEAEGRVRPAREALTELGARLGFRG
jgi:Arc/MetJ-type ribon-helix-helix transcriptional regulator